MGQTKRKRAILETNRFCIFCGGREAATTLDHQPARSLFDRRVGPVGYEFPACQACNQASKDAEHKLAVLVRAENVDLRDPIKKHDFNKYLGGMRNNFPDLLKPLSANQKRKYLRAEGIGRPPGFALAHFHILKIDQQRFEPCEMAFSKLLRALYWKHSGKIVTHGDGVQAIPHSNAYFRAFLKSEEAQYYGGLPIQPPIVRNNRDLSDQFFYRYGQNETSDVAAFLIVFRRSFLVTGIVTQSDELLSEIRSFNEREGL